MAKQMKTLKLNITFLFLHVLMILPTFIKINVDVDELSKDPVYHTDLY